MVNGVERGVRQADRLRHRCQAMVDGRAVVFHDIGPDHGVGEPVVGVVQGSDSVRDGVHTA